MSEQVLVVPRTVLFRAGDRVVSGFQSAGVAGYLDRVARSGRFAPRDQVEEDPSLQQIIPYGIVCLDEPCGGKRVFLMRRTRGGNESRLHDLYSIGVGGHINPGDDTHPIGVVGARDRVRVALDREITEELYVDTSYTVSCVGVINDDSNAVGEVHFGIVYRIDVESPRVRVRETDQLEGRFVPIEELSAYSERLESWSRHVSLALEAPE